MIEEKTAQLIALKISEIIVDSLEADDIRLSWPQYFNIRLPKDFSGNEVRRIFQTKVLAEILRQNNWSVPLKLKVILDEAEERVVCLKSSPN